MLRRKFKSDFNATQRSILIIQLLHPILRLSRPRIAFSLKKAFKITARACFGATGASKSQLEPTSEQLGLENGSTWAPKSDFELTFAQEWLQKSLFEPMFAQEGLRNRCLSPFLGETYSEKVPIKSQRPQNRHSRPSKSLKNIRKNKVFVIITIFEPRLQKLLRRLQT